MFWEDPHTPTPFWEQGSGMGQEWSVWMAEQCQSGAKRRPPPWSPGLGKLMGALPTRPAQGPKETVEEVGSGCARGGGTCLQALLCGCLCLQHVSLSKDMGPLCRWQPAQKGETGEELGLARVVGQ